MRRRGFTLIELLVVIAIIAILASILMPSLRRAKRQAVLVQCALNLRSTHQAMQMYGADFTYYPLVGEVDPHPYSPVIAGYKGAAPHGGTGPPGQLLTGQYLSDARIAHCPGLGGPTDFGWPRGIFSASTEYTAYFYCQVSRYEIETYPNASPAWNVNLRYSNSAWGGMLFTCVDSNHLRDPRSYTHQNIDNQIRNDGSSRRYTIPVVGIVQYAPDNVQAIFSLEGYTTSVHRDAWWMAGRP